MNYFMHKLTFIVALKISLEFSPHFPVLAINSLKYASAFSGYPTEHNGFESLVETENPNGLLIFKC